MALWAAVVGIGMVGFEATVADAGWADPTRTPTASADRTVPTGSQASRSGPVTSPTESSEGPTDPSATPSETHSPSVSADPTPSTSATGRPSERYGPARDQTPVGRHQGSRVIPPASPTGAAAAPPRSPALADQGRGRYPVQTGYVSRVVAQGLIVVGAMAFVVSMVGMMLVGWIRRRV
jgi:hypothetical protein